MIGYLMMHADAAAGSDGEDSSDLNTSTVSLQDLRKSTTYIPCTQIKKARNCYKRHKGIAVFQHDVQGEEEGSVCFSFPTKLE